MEYTIYGSLNHGEMLYDDVVELVNEKLKVPENKNGWYVSDYFMEFNGSDILEENGGRDLEDLIPILEEMDLFCKGTLNFVGETFKSSFMITYEDNKLVERRSMKEKDFLALISKLGGVCDNYEQLRNSL